MRRYFGYFSSSSLTLNEVLSLPKPGFLGYAFWSHNYVCLQSSQGGKASNIVWGLCTVLNPPTHLPSLIIVSNWIVVLGWIESCTFVGTEVATGYTFILEMALKQKHMKSQVKHFSYLETFACSSQRKYSQVLLMITLIWLGAYFIESDLRDYYLATGAGWGIL